MTDEDVKQLYQFAVQFHFDWMLLPRELWKTEIVNASLNEDEKEQLMTAIVSFFKATPKSTDERETECLSQFLKKYWEFNCFPKIDDVAERALRLILDDPDALGKYNDLKEVLKVYDDCRFKFIEMSKAIVNDNVNDNDN